MHYERFKSDGKVKHVVFFVSRKITEDGVLNLFLVLLINSLTIHKQDFSLN